MSPVSSAYRVCLAMVRKVTYQVHTLTLVHHQAKIFFMFHHSYINMKLHPPNLFVTSIFHYLQKENYNSIIVNWEKYYYNFGSNFISFVFLCICFIILIYFFLFSFVSIFNSHSSFAGAFFIFILFHSFSLFHIFFFCSTFLLYIRIFWCLLFILLFYLLFCFFRFAFYILSFIIYFV